MSVCPEHKGEENLNGVSDVPQGKPQKQTTREITTDLVNTHTHTQQTTSDAVVQDGQSVTGHHTRMIPGEPPQAQQHPPPLKAGTSGALCHKKTQSVHEKGMTCAQSYYLGFTRRSPPGFCSTPCFWEAHFLGLKSLTTALN